MYVIVRRRETCLRQISKQQRAAKESQRLKEHHAIGAIDLKVFNVNECLHVHGWISRAHVIISKVKVPLVNLNEFLG